MIKKPFGIGGIWESSAAQTYDSRMDKTTFTKPQQFSLSTYWRTRRGTYHGKDPNISNVYNKFYFTYHQRASRTNLLVKNIYITRTNSGRHSGNKSQSCVPYIIPSGMPGPKGYLTVENIYVKLNYTENNPGAIGGNHIASEENDYDKDRNVAERNHEDTRTHTCIFKNCVYDYNGHDAPSGQDTYDSFMWYRAKDGANNTWNDIKYARNGWILQQHCFVGAHKSGFSNSPPGTYVVSNTGQQHVSIDGNVGIQNCYAVLSYNPRDTAAGYSIAGDVESIRTKLVGDISGHIVSSPTFMCGGNSWVWGGD